MTSPSFHRQIMPPLWIFTLVGMVLMVWLLFALKEIVMLVVIGFSIAYVMEPALRLFEEKGLTRSLGVIVLVLLCVAVISGMAVTAIPTILREYHDLSENLHDYVVTAKEKAMPYLEHADAYVPVDQLLSSPMEAVKQSSGIVKQLALAGGKALMRGYSVTLTLVNLTLLPFIVYYIAVDFRSIRPAFLSLFPFIKRGPVDEILSEINDYVSAFVRGQILVGAIMTLLYAAGMGIIGVELWLLLAVIAGFGNLIPYLGSLVGIVLATVMTLVTFGDVSHLFMVWGVFAVVQILEGSLITPRIQGDSVGLSPLIVILAIVAGGSLFGLLGIFLAVPGAAILRVLVTHIHNYMIRT